MVANALTTHDVMVSGTVVKKLTEPFKLTGRDSSTRFNISVPNKKLGASN